MWDYIEELDEQNSIIREPCLELSSKRRISIGDFIVSNVVDKAVSTIEHIASHKAVGVENRAKSSHAARSLGAAESTGILAFENS